MLFSNNPLIFLFKRTWNYSKGNRPKLVLAMVLSVLAKAQVFINPLIVAWLLNTVQKEGVSYANIYKLLGIASLLVVTQFTFWALHGPSRVLERKNAFLMRNNYREYLINGTLALPLEWHTDHHSGDTIDKIAKGSWGLFEFADSLFEPIHLIVQFILSYIALLIFNIHSAYIVLFMAFLAFFTIIKMDEKLEKQYDELNLNDNEISAKIFDSISNITTVVILGLQKLISKDIIRKMMKPFIVFSKNAKLNEIKWFLVSVYSGLMIFLVLGSYLVSSLMNGTVILVGTLYALFAYVNEINDIFFSLANTWSSLVQKRAFIRNVELLSKDFVDEELVERRELDKWKQLEIRNLSFKYTGKKDAKLNLSNVSLIINKGEKIALVGESGSGKTTFMKLLKGLYEPNEGEVLLDRQLLKHKFKALRSNTTLIPQEPELFATTIRKNITMGLPYSQEEIEGFAKLACFDKVAQRLPKKYESSIVEKGVNLSGGEKQRLALVRGLLAAKDTPLVLMDEPTSSVDSANEMTIFENMFRRFNGKTILASIHRLHLLRLFDKILLFEEGNIVAEGAFDELLTKSKKFSTLWKKYTQKHKIRKI